jgi:hypothetical protein
MPSVLIEHPDAITIPTNVEIIAFHAMISDIFDRMATALVTRVLIKNEFLFWRLRRFDYV